MKSRLEKIKELLEKMSFKTTSETRFSCTLQKDNLIVEVCDMADEFIAQDTSFSINISKYINPKKSSKVYLTMDINILNFYNPNISIIHENLQVMKLSREIHAKILTSEIFEH